MSKSNNNLLNAINPNSEKQKNITEVEWNKIDKDKILYKISNSSKKEEFEKKYNKLDIFFKQEWEQIYKTTKKDLRLFKEPFQNQDIKNNIDTISISKALLQEFNLTNKVKEINQLNSELEKYWLEWWVDKLLEWYSQYIKVNLWNLNDSIIQKIRASIWIKTLSILDDMDAIENRIENLWETDKKENFRWVVNWKIQDNFWEINNKILPSALLFNKYLWNKDNIKEKIKTAVSKQAIEEKQEYYNIKRHRNKIWLERIKTNDKKLADLKWERKAEKVIKEIQEMFDAELDTDWQFDEFGAEYFNQMGTLQIDRWEDKHIFDNIWWNSEDLWKINILSEVNQEIEKKAMLFFIGGIAAHIAIEVGPAIVWSAIPWPWTAIWALVWAWLWAGLDIKDVFSDREEIMVLLQKAWLVPEEFRMDKTWIDNILAWVWLVPGATVAIKWWVLANLMTKFNVSDKKLLDSVKKVLPILKGWWEKWEKVSVDIVWKNSKLNDADKLTESEKIIWELTKAQQEYIIKAHNVWWLSNTWEKKSMKIEILNTDIPGVDYEKKFLDIWWKVRNMYISEYWDQWWLSHIEKWILASFKAAFTSADEFITWDFIELEVINNILLRKALKKLPDYKWTVWRWVKIDVNDFLRQIENDIWVDKWWFTWTSISKDIWLSFMENDNNHGTLLKIKSKSWKYIEWFKDVWEEEVLFNLWTRFNLLSVNWNIVELEEVD